MLASRINLICQGDQNAIKGGLIELKIKVTKFPQTNEDINVQQQNQRRPEFSSFTSLSYRPLRPGIW